MKRFERIQADRRLDQVAILGVISLQEGKYELPEIIALLDPEDAFRLGQDLEQQAAKALASTNGSGEED